MTTTDAKTRLDYLEDLEEAKRYAELVDRMKLAAVKGARDEGATWEQIGYALGITHQGARSTWQRRLKALTKGDATR